MSRANPLPGTQVIAAVQSQCGIESEPGERYADDRRCGDTFASANGPPLDAYGQEWMELTVTPKPGEPHLMQVVSRYRGGERVLPAPEAKEVYTEFLKSRPFEQ